jgi:hypothetical protein
MLVRKAGEKTMWFLVFANVVLYWVGQYIMIQNTGQGHSFLAATFGLVMSTISVAAPTIYIAAKSKKWESKKATKKE